MKQLHMLEHFEGGVFLLLFGGVHFIVFCVKKSENQKLHYHVSNTVVWDGVSSHISFMQKEHTQKLEDVTFQMIIVVWTYGL